MKDNRYMDPEDYLYERFVNESNWFNDYEFEQYYEAFRKPFMDEHPEIEDQEDEVDEILRDLMYTLDMYDADIIAAPPFIASSGLVQPWLLA